MDHEEFRQWSHRAADWGADYRKNIASLPVRARTKPGEILAQLPAEAPELGEDFTKIFADFEKIVMPGMTHWQHPRFFAYFSANAAPASVIAEYITSVIAAQCMLWQTSPAATELETRMIEWMRAALGLPGEFSGVIQDSASSATLSAILVMRERALSWNGNRSGLSSQPQIRVYASPEVHSSIDRAIWVSGIGEANLVRIPTAGQQRGMSPAALEDAIRSDIDAGFVPAGVVACVGGTSTGACDPVGEIAEICRKFGLYLHVDAAWAGSAMICEEFRPLWRGVESADSIVFNPHKWLGAQFDCSIQFIRNPSEQVKTLAIHPEYLKTHGQDGILNYSEWTIPLGRRFRSLKLWFLLRHHGLEGLRTMVRNHVTWSRNLAERLRAEADFEIVTEPILSLFAFRHRGAQDLDAHNLSLVNRINDDGRIYLTQTRVDGHIAIRFQAGQSDLSEADVDIAFNVIRELAR